MSDTEFERLQGLSGDLPLTGGVTDTVVRIGDTVRRPPGDATRLMRAVLLHVERIGFDAAPRWLGVDGRGRDVLTWIEGDTLVERSRLHPYLGDPAFSITFSAQQLTAVLHLLRRYHDAFGEHVMCHGDFGPWNLIWRDGLPVAVIDFGNVHDGEPEEDIAYALRTFVGYGLVSEDAAALVRLTRLALAAYGADFDVPAILAREYDRAEERCHRNGWERQLAKLPLEREWFEQNRALF